MRRGTPGSALSRRNWIARILLALIVAAAGYYAVSAALANAVAKTNIEDAYRLARGNARIAGELARARLLEKIDILQKDGDQRASLVRQLNGVERLALTSLNHNPTAVGAAATLGAIAELKGRLGQARRYYNYAETLSRRDFPVQLWLIEDAVGRSDIQAALRHYDIALRTKKSSATLLFPIMAGSSGDPAISGPLVKVLLGKPLWAPDFVQYLARSTTTPAATVALFRDLAKNGYPISEEDRRDLVHQMIVNRDFDLAWNYYASFEPRADKSRSRDPDFRRNVPYPTDFDWSVADGGTGMSVSVQGDERSAYLDFSVPATQSGVIAQQLQMLPAGNYKFQGRSDGIEQTAEAEPYWVLRCVSDGTELGRVDVPNSSSQGGVFRGRFVVPQSCPVQSLALVARSSNAISGVSGRIVYAAIQPDR